MARLRKADRRDSSQPSFLELARDVWRAQELRDAELERAPHNYERALRGSVDHAAEFLKIVQKGDVVYDQAMWEALERYRAARSAGASHSGRAAQARGD
jgi:hypothetical protein